MYSHLFLVRDVMCMYACSAILVHQWISRTIPDESALFAAAMQIRIPSKRVVVEADGEDSKHDAPVAAYPGGVRFV